MNSSNTQSLLAAVLVAMFPVVALSADPASNTVYSCDFSSEVGREAWSKRITDVTPKGQRQFLGQFGTEEIMLSVTNLPSHTYLRLSFDLFLIRTWDGSTPTWGVSTWAASVVGGQVLLYTTFSNCGFFTDNNAQAFPDSFPDAIHPGWTGATEKQSLGYVFPRPGPDEKTGCDSVYHFDLAFPHRADAVKFQFQAFKGEWIQGESWGLANVQVQTLRDPPSANLTDQQLGQLWEDLAGDDAVKAFHAVWKLAGAADRTVAFLRDRMVPKRLPDETIRRLLAELDAETYQIREQASRQLKNFGRAVAADLNKELAKATSPEVRYRLEELIRSLPSETEDKGEKLRYARALQALEIIGSDAAKAVLKQFHRSPRRIEELKKEPALKSQQ